MIRDAAAFVKRRRGGRKNTCGGVREGFGRRREIPGDLMPYNWEEYRDKGYHVDGTAYRGFHEWDTWRFAARDFARKLFR